MGELVEEDFLTLYCDPGEDFGWCVGKGLSLLAAGTEKMWSMADAIWDKIHDPAPGPTSTHIAVYQESVNPLSADTHIRKGIDPELMKLPIGRVVCEDFRIYPWEARKGSLDWDPVRTARVIGAITFMCRLYHIPLRFQGADIKEAAQAAGAEELYYRPLTENRHQNDAIQHFVFYTNVELLQLPMLVPDSVRTEDHS
jgi:hypothetical protein